MVKFEDQCCDCGLPCLVESCQNRNIKIYECDDCHDEVISGELYEYDDEQLCLSCIEKRLVKVQ